MTSLKAKSIIVTEEERLPAGGFSKNYWLVETNYSYTAPQSHYRAACNGSADKSIELLSKNDYNSI